MATPNGRTPTAPAPNQTRDDETRARLAAMVRSSADAIVGETLEGIVTDWNPAAERLYGYPADEVIGRHLTMLVPPERLAEAEAILRQVRRGEQVTDVETVRWTKDGRRLEVSLTISPVWNDAGEIIATSAIVRDITERKADAAELAASHQHTRQLMECITDGFLAVDRDWGFTYVNAAAEQMLGQPRESLLGRHAWEAFAPAIDSPVYAAAQQAMHKGITTTIEVYYPPFDAWFDVRLYPSADGLSAFIRDVTERRRLIEELRASEARFRALVEQLPAAVYVLAADVHMTPVYASPYLEVLTGYPPGDVLDAAHWLEIVHPDDRDRAAAEDARSVATQEAFGLDYRFVRNDGGLVWVRDECVPMRDATGTLIGWLGVMIDITDRVAAAEAHGRLAAIVESAEDAIISSDLDGRITSWNRGAQKLYGYRAAEIVGQPYAVLLPEELNDPLLTGRIAAVRAGATDEPFETVRRRRDGSLVEVAIALSPIRDRDGTVFGQSSITRDITARKALEAELRTALREAQAANEAKSAFLAMMSHELRTPLQAVLGYAEFLLANPSSTLTPEEREDLGYIQQGGQRMLSLITQLLDLSRIEAGRLELVRKPVDVYSMLEQVRQDVVPQAAQKGLALQLVMPDELPTVLGDPERLRQIVLNLVGNAVKFTDTGSIGITVASTRDELVITVRDTGIGIAPEALPHIFERFRQVDGRLARRHGGAGLGLAIAQKLAGLMDGRITAESEPGVGSVFALHLPLLSPPEPTQPAQETRLP